MENITTAHASRGRAGRVYLERRLGGRQDCPLSGSARFCMAGVVVSVPMFSGWGSHSRNLPADSWPAHSQCASRYLLPALLPLGGQLQ